mmetsp:Transcript_42394/g.68030  ORF Transcript_42394/g.68030 Transcript_42394/m.68030 type:complete len:117 (+) Transcript_42394:584-934(+)
METPLGGESKKNFLNVVAESSSTSNYEETSAWATRLWDNIHGNVQKENENSRLRTSVSKLLKTQSPTKILKILEGLFCTDEKVVRPLSLKYLQIESTRTRAPQNDHVACVNLHAQT